MKKILHKIHAQPPQFRLMLSVIIAGTITAIIAVIWMYGLFGGSGNQSQSDNAPSPFNSLVSSIKTTVQNSPVSSSSANQVQIINADDASSSAQVNQ